MMRFLSQLFGFEYESGGEKENTAIKFLAQLFRFGVVLLIIFSFGTTFYGLRNLTWDIYILNFLWKVSMLCLIAFACFAVGGLMGFLFGIPISVANNLKANNSGYADNDNLVQISDWLTKIIVGVSLTQLINIPPALESLGSTLGPSFYSDEKLGKVASVAVVIYFSITGFTISYLWTRLYFKKLLVKTDNDIMNMLPSYLSVGIQPSDYKQKQYTTPVYTTKKSVGHKEAPANDPQKYQWGEKAESNGRKLSAVVSPVSWNPDYFNVELKLVSTDPANALKGKVIFHLHPSFRNSDPTVEVVNGIASINVLAWGAFTVGAEADDGETQLELDLAQLNSAPALFRSR